jgi:hypothetical protein
MAVGDTFLLNLGEGYLWDVAPADPAIISRKVNITVVRGAQGVYEAHAVGTTTLTGSGEPECSQSKPPCEAPSILFQLTVVVK